MARGGGGGGGGGGVGGGDLVTLANILFPNGMQPTVAKGNHMIAIQINIHCANPVF